MGLDIYVRWDGITEKERQAQITGFDDAPEAGYLRASWPGYGLLKELSDAMNITLPLAGCHAYGDNADNQAIITDETMAQLCEWRQEWLAAVDLPVPTTEPGVEAFFRQKLRNSAAMVDFIEAKRNEGKTGLLIGYW